MDSIHRKIYRFEDVEVDLGSYTLTRGGEELHLRRKAFQVLVYLLEHADELVTKDELIEHVWQDVAVTDDTLVQCIKEIRRAVGDVSNQSRLIKTVPKSGYRFIGSIADDQGHDQMPAAKSFGIPVGTHVPENFSLVDQLLSRRVLLAGLIVIGSFILLGFLGLPGVIERGWWRTDGNTAAITLPVNPDKISIAVTYFKNQSNTPELGWLSEGIADMLITDLSRSPKLNILSRQQFHSWLEKAGVERGVELTFDQSVGIARKSKADHFILGSFGRLNDKIRLDVQLYEVKSGSLVAAESLIADKPDQILTDIDLLSLKLVKRLCGNVTEPAGRLSEMMTSNLEAYRYYSLGVEKAQALHSREAVDYLEKAALLDPQFAMAHARIGYAYAISQGDSEKGKPYLEKAFGLSDRLTEKDRLSISAWYSIANLDYGAAIRTYREIIAKYPLETEAYWRLGGLLDGEGQSVEAVEILKQGLIADPDEKDIYNRLGSVLSTLGRHEEAIATHRRYVSLAPDEPNAYDSLGLTYQWSGDYESAIANYNRSLDLNSKFEIAVIHLANAKYQLGQYREALDLYRRYVDLAPTNTEKWRGYKAISSVYLAKHDIGAAEKAADQALKFSRNNFWSKFSTALERRDFAAATKYRDDSLNFQAPNRGARLTQRYLSYTEGLLALRTGKPDAAITSFRHVLTFKPPVWDIDTYEDCLANTLLETGRVDEAITEYNRILAINPNYPRLYFHLAQAYERKGENGEARENYTKFLEVWKNADQDVDEVQTAKKFLNNNSAV